MRGPGQREARGASRGTSNADASPPPPKGRTLLRAVALGPRAPVCFPFRSSKIAASRPIAKLGDLPSRGPTLHAAPEPHRRRRLDAGPVPRRPPQQLRESLPRNAPPRRLSADGSRRRGNGDVREGARAHGLHARSRSQPETRRDQRRRDLALPPTKPMTRTYYLL